MTRGDDVSARLIDDIRAYIPAAEVFVGRDKTDTNTVTIVVDEVHRSWDWRPLRRHFASARYDGKPVAFTILMDDLQKYVENDEYDTLYCQEMGAIAYAMATLRALFSARR